MNHRLSFTIICIRRKMLRGRNLVTSISLIFIGLCLNFSVIVLHPSFDYFVHVY